LVAINSVRPQYQQVNFNKKVEYPSIPISIEPLIKNKKASKDMYNILIANEQCQQVGKNGILFFT